MIPATCRRSPAWVVSRVLGLQRNPSNADRKLYRASARSQGVSPPPLRILRHWVSFGWSQLHHLGNIVMRFLLTAESIPWAVLLDRGTEWV